METKRNLIQWLYYLLGIRNWQLKSNDLNIIWSDDGLYKIGEAIILVLYCPLSNCEKIITCNKVIYEKPI